MFDNYNEQSNNVEEDYNYLKDRPGKEWDKWSGRISKMKRAISQWADNNENASAEIKSLLKIKDEIKGEIEARLIATDTILSRLAAEIISSSINSQVKVDYNPSSDCISGLQVENRKKFEQLGLVGLIERINEITGGWYENVCLNITGGYKAVIPYLTIMGQVNNMPLYYIFETTDQLLKLPQVPININWGIFEKYSHVLSDLASGIARGWEEYQIKHNLPEDLKSCVWAEDGMAELNALGKMFWLKYQNFITINITKGTQYFNDTGGNKAEVNKALKELYKRLTNYITNNAHTDENAIITAIKSLPNTDDLRHGDNPGENIFIFKSTDQAHIRIAYSFTYQKNILKLSVYDYVRGTFNHDKYIKLFKQKISAQKNPEFITITLKK
ncbi:MAG: hypothetical protein PHO01_09715 [Desulfotomaculaceae bacterium]|nr:hypothetical protein [Desulfotomaculaceae bacterium]